MIDPQDPDSVVCDEIGNNLAVARLHRHSKILGLDWPPNFGVLIDLSDSVFDCFSHPAQTQRASVGQISVKLI